MKNDWNPGKWVLIWEHTERAIYWIPTWQGLDVFKKSLRPCALDETSLSIGRVNHAIKSEGEMLIRIVPTTLLQIFRKTILNYKDIVKSIIDPDDNFSKNS